jgi:hypothetical protein
MRNAIRAAGGLKPEKPFRRFLPPRGAMPPPSLSGLGLQSVGSTVW